MADCRNRGSGIVAWVGVAAVAAVAVLAAGERASAEPATVPPEMLADAALFDVQFVDADRGWAVGDRGVIWVTEDGGRHWRLADSPVNSRLDAVHFTDERHGWAVGGWLHPYTHRTSAVVLRTENGGERWRRIDTPTLPGLHDVQMLDKHHGWAIGDGSAMYPTGVFRTDDGGRAWYAAPGSVGRDWLAVALRGRDGALVGRGGARARVVDGNLQTEPAVAGDLRNLRDVCLAGRLGWAVGDGGQALRTGDGGTTWQPVALPPGVQRLFDFRAVAAVGDHCWIAGAPGGSIWHSADGGQTWDRQATGNSPPLHAMCFHDERRGWAVGALGTILATRDGGQTWRVQRAGGRRAAWLCVVGEPERTPFELVSRLSGDEGYLGVVEYLGRRDIEPARRTDAANERRAWAAISLAGGSHADTAWAFPLRQHGLQLASETLVAGWNVVHRNEALERLEEHVVRAIRQWRPEVIVTEHAGVGEDDPLARLTHQVVLAAVQQAADPRRYPDHARLADLAPWSVKKVFARQPSDTPGTLTLDSARLATRLGCSLGDQAMHARSRVLAGWQRGPEQTGFQLLVNQLPDEIGQRDFFSGITLERPSDARRAAGGPATTDLDALTRLARKKSVVQRLLERAAKAPSAAVGWLAQIDDLTTGLDSQAAGDVLYELGQNFAESGHHDLAADVLHTLVQRYPDHALTEPAIIWLLRHDTSAELAHWVASGRQAEGGRFQVQPPAEALDDEAPEERLIPLGTGEPLVAVAGPTAAQFQLASQQRLATVERGPRGRELVESIRRVRPAMFAEPAIQFLAARAAEAAGNPRDAKQLFTAMTKTAPTAWARSARGELWLADEHGPAPKPLIRCESTSRRPRLDGRLDDDVWQTAQPAALASGIGDDTDWPATVQLAYDDRFLYVAAQCRKPPGIEYTTTDEPRPRDPDLTNHDRIDLLLDIDRDYNTWYRLTVDHRGWTGEACWDDRSWNPQWYVAASSNKQEWVVEAAIHLDQLTGHHPRPNQCWAIGIQRILPTVGFQSWTHPAAATTPLPEGFGYVQFR